MTTMTATTHMNGLRGTEVHPDVFAFENGYVAHRLAIEAHGGRMEPNSDRIDIPEKALETARRMTLRKVALK